MHQIGRPGRKAVVALSGPAEFDHHVPALDIPAFGKPVAERRRYVLAQGRRAAGSQIPDDGQRIALRRCGERHDKPAADQQREEAAPPHSMTSSARAEIDCGIGHGNLLLRRCKRRTTVDGLVVAPDDVRVRLIISPNAARNLAALPVRDRRALFLRVEAFAADPFAVHPAARPLRGYEDRVRVRHGDWRAVCRIDRADEAVILECVEHRREVYR
jgi:mRNA-degrading endonuclease RelE of RelBE toxin-antitoxin system